jgi:D-alanyl-D-alanine carboxypeptidase
MRAPSLLPALWCLAILGTSAPPAGVSETGLEVKLQSVLERGIEKHDTRGVSGAIVFPDGRLWTGVSGISHGTVAMESDMLFGIGSITKNFVAALTLQLVEEGTLSLDDAVSEHLRPFPHVEDSITIRQLLNHTSGLYMFWDNDELWDALKADRTRVWTPEEVLTYIRKPYFEPGEGWHYSNTNYLLLGMIIEKATGSSLSAEFRSRFWDPLGIEGYLSIQEEIPGRLAHVFGDDFHYGPAEEDLTFEPRASHESIIFGSGGLFMTATDLARWSQALFGGQVLGEESMAEMLEFVPFRPAFNMRAYGLGVQRFERRFSSGREAIGHGGGNIGSTTYMVYLPAYEVSIVVMVNAFPTTSGNDIAKRLIREVLRERGELGLIPYFPFFPIGFLICCFLLFLTVIFLFRFRPGHR